MTNIRSLLANRVRLGLVSAICFINVGLFLVASPEARRTCEKCGWVEGGAVGYYADCVGSGNISLCRAGGWNFCVGYACNGAGGEEENFDPEGEPPMIE